MVPKGISRSWFCEGCPRLNSQLLRILPLTPTTPFTHLLPLLLSFPQAAHLLKHGITMVGLFSSLTNSKSKIDRCLLTCSRTWVPLRLLAQDCAYERFIVDIAISVMNTKKIQCQFFQSKCTETVGDEGSLTLLYK